MQTKQMYITIKNKKYHIVGTVWKSNSKILERGKMYTPNTQIHDRALFGYGTGTPIKKVLI